MTFPFTRRALIGGIAAGGAIASTRLAAATVDRATRLVIVQQEIPVSARQLIAELQAGVATLELTRDVVRQWRDGLGARVASAGKAVAYVPWAQAQILAGLVREAGGTAQIANFAPQLFEVTLGLTTTGREG